MDAGSDAGVNAHRFALATALLAIAFGATVLAGWIFDAAALKALMAGWTQTNVRVGLCLAVIGVALAVLRRTLLSSAASSAASVCCRWPSQRRRRLCGWAWP